MSVSVFIAETVEDGFHGLPPDEQARALDIRSAKRRREFVSVRSLLRLALRQSYGRRAEAWRLEYASNGAPRLREVGSMRACPAVSLSHSRGYVACALSEVSALGIDIELTRPRSALAEIAGRVLHPEEMGEFLRLNEEAAQAFFYAKWVLKEALGKALGYGLAYPMQDCLLDRDRLVSAPAAWIEAPGSWAFSHAQLDCGLSLGLAWQGRAVDCASINTVEIRL